MALRNHAKSMASVMLIENGRHTFGLEKCDCDRCRSIRTILAPHSRAPPTPNANGACRDPTVGPKQPAFSFATPHVGAIRAQLCYLSQQAGPPPSLTAWQLVDIELVWKVPDARQPRGAVHRSFHRWDGRIITRCPVREANQVDVRGQHSMW